MELVARAADGFHGTDAEPALKAKALANLETWLTQPAFAAYRPQLEWLVRSGQWPGLIDRFYQILPFGTGGRRGAVGIGPNRMNLWTLGASVQGHCEYLKERFAGVRPLSVAVAYDVRRFEDCRRQYNPELPNPALHLSSRAFAHQAACVYAANGIDVWTLPPDSSRFLATPELSFLIRHVGAHGGLNISASHNPPDDNGGKFYDERGGQPIAPDDQIMAELVDEVSVIRTLPWADAVASGHVRFIDDGPHRAYVELCRRQSLVPPPKFDEIQIVFTPLHGVGSMTALVVLAAQGFRAVPVEDQMAPDGQFPNVRPTPNPEVPASLDRAAAVAGECRADLVLATDPDADRVGALAPARGQAPGTPDAWRFLNGNEIAALLTHFKLARLAEQGRLPGSPIVVCTEVTTSLVTRVARHFGAQVVNNLLVGFKYIADVLAQLETAGAYEDVRGSPADFVIASEESHGILAMPQIRDKDAGAACLLMAELALDQKRRGRTVLDYLDQIFRQFGYVRNDMVPVVMSGLEGKAQMARMMERLRAAPPRELSGLAVTHIEDLRDEDGRLGPIKGDTDRAARNFLIFRMGETAKVSLRPSGTEPKAKAYIEVASPPQARASDDERQRTRRQVDDTLRRLADDFLAQALALVGLTPPAR
jgi:phosphoglucomutase/phosphomannomutase